MLQATTTKGKLARNLQRTAMNPAWTDISLVNDIVLRSLQEQHLSGKLRPNELDHTGVSLLHKAALDGQLACLKWLIKHGGDPTIRSIEGSVPSHYAAGGGHIHILQYLHEICKESVSYKDNKKAAPLHIAAQEGQLDCLIWLTKSSAISPNDKTIDGITPSHLSAQEGRLECLRYLIKNAHAQDKVLDNNGATILHYACSEGQTIVSKWLIQHSSLNGDEKDSIGATALHIAARGGFIDTLETLLKCNVTVDAKDNQGKTALDYAIQHQKNKCATILKDAMMKISGSIKLQKKVRFDEHVYISDATILSGIHSNKKYKKMNLWETENMQAQFESWLLNSQNIKRRRDPEKKANTLFKGKSKHLNNSNKEISSDKDHIKKDEAKIPIKVDEPQKTKLDSPDILKNLNDEPKIKREIEILTGSPGSNSPVSTLSNENNDVIINNDVIKSENEQPRKEETKNQDSNNNSNNKRFRSDYDKKKRKNIMKHSPPEVPKRNSGLNLTVVRQNSLISLYERSAKELDAKKVYKNKETSHEVTYPDYFFENEENKTKIHNSKHQNLNSQNSTRKSSSLENLQIEADENEQRQYIQRKDTLKYLPKSYFNNKHHYAYRVEEMGAKNTDLHHIMGGLKDEYKNGLSIHRAFPQKQTQTSENTFDNFIDDLPDNGVIMGPMSQRDKIEFFSNNMHSKHNKGSRWSTLRQGFTSLFNTIRNKKADQREISTWGASFTSKPSSTPREDIFSRFSINRRKEFDDLFNSSADGFYHSYDEEMIMQSNRPLTSLQQGYGKDDLARFRQQSLDNTLKGQYKGKPNKKVQFSKKKNGEKGNAFIW